MVVERLVVGALLEDAIDASCCRRYGGRLLPGVSSLAERLVVGALLEDAIDAS